MRILCQSLKSRFADRIEVALWEEISYYEPGRPTRYIVTTADRAGHEWEYEDLGSALHHFQDLCEARKSRSPGRYEKPVAQEEKP